MPIKPKMMKRAPRLNLVLLWLTLLHTLVFAQTNTSETPFSSIKGLPGIIHYNRESFNADPQFWTVTEDKAGITYFGNNDGVLIYDGEEWHQITLPNSSSVRSLTTDSLGNVYAGGFNEFGLVKKDETGQYYYESSLDSLRLYGLDVGNLWQATIIGNKLIYRSFNELVVVENNKATRLPSPSAFIYAYVYNNQYLVQDQHSGIQRLNLETMTFEQEFSNAQFRYEEIISMLPTNQPDELLATSKTGTLFRVNMKKKTVKILRELFEEKEINQIISTTQVSQNLYYLGTLSSGIIAVNQDGATVQGGHNFDELQDNSVLNLYKNQHGNVWALLNNGLDLITHSSPVTTIFKDASIYDVLIQGNDIYLATNQGVFYTSTLNTSNQSFTKVKGLEGQAWTLQVLKGDILVGMDKGLFQVNKLESKRIGNTGGIWKVIPIKSNPDLFIVSYYSGMQLLAKENGEWKILRHIQGFDESTRDILETDTPGTFWVCHGYRGVFRLMIDKEFTRVTSLEHFTTQNGFKSPYNINVFEWQGEEVFTSNDGVFSYNAKNNLFEPFQALNVLLDSTVNTRTLLEYEGKTWFVQDDEIGYFETNAKNPKLEKGIFLQFKGTLNKGMECIIPLNNNQVLIGSKTGLYLVDLTYSNNRKAASTIITGINYTSKEDQGWLPISNSASLTLPNGTSSLRFNFASPGIEGETDIQYAYKLVNADKEWSDWQLTPFKEYSHLRPGRYEFEVKSRSLLGTEGQTASIVFQILPLWYQTIWAVIGYILAAILVIVFLIRMVKKRIALENIKALETEQKAKKLLELELEQFKLKAEKEKISQDKQLLEEDVLYKSKELANYTMLLVKKKEIFSEIQEDIKDVRRMVRNEMSRRKLQKMFTKLNQHAIDEEYLQVFETNFEKVHHQFFDVLKKRFPELSQRELRLCAFIKMNLSNKEISPLLNISVRGVETARYRIRKKLNMEHDLNLNQFLENIGSEHTSEVSQS